MSLPRKTNQAQKSPLLILGPNINDSTQDDVRKDIYHATFLNLIRISGLNETPFVDESAITRSINSLTSDLIAKAGTFKPEHTVHLPWLCQAGLNVILADLAVKLSCASNPDLSGDIREHLKRCELVMEIIAQRKLTANPFLLELVTYILLLHQEGTIAFNEVYDAATSNKLCWSICRQSFVIVDSIEDKNVQGFIVDSKLNSLFHCNLIMNLVTNGLAPFTINAISSIDEDGEPFVFFKEVELNDCLLVQFKISAES